MSPKRTTQSSVKPSSSAEIFHGMNSDSTCATKARASSIVCGLRPVMHIPQHVHHRGTENTERSFGVRASRPRAGQRPAVHFPPCSPCLRLENGLAQFRHDPERLRAAGDALAIVEGVAPALPVVV